MTKKEVFDVVASLLIIFLTFYALKISKHSDSIAENSEGIAQHSDSIAQQGIVIARHGLTISQNQAADHSAIDTLTKIETDSRQQIDKMTDLVARQNQTNANLVAQLQKLDSSLTALKTQIRIQTEQGKVLNDQKFLSKLIYDVDSSRQDYENSKSFRNFWHLTHEYKALSANPDIVRTDHKAQINVINETNRLFKAMSDDPLIDQRDDLTDHINGIIKNGDNYLKTYDSAAAIGNESFLTRYLTMRANIFSRIQYFMQKKEEELHVTEPIQIKTDVYDRLF